MLECNVMFGAFVRVGGLERGQIERERERGGAWSAAALNTSG